MKRIAIASLLILGACASAEDRQLQRFERWASACGYPEVALADLQPCVFAYEDAYLANKAMRQQRGLAMMSLGSSMMAMPAAAPRALPQTCTTQVMQNGRSESRVCY